MWKTILAGTAALAIGGATLAYANPDHGKDARKHGWRPSAEDITAYGDARIAGLKAGLALNADQEKLWPPVESAMRELAKQRAERVAARGQAERPSSPIERLDRRADAMQNRGAALKKFAEAAGPLYDSLDDAQKRRFMALAHVGSRHFGRHSHRGWHGRHHSRHGWHHHRGHHGGRSADSDHGPRAQ